MKPLFVILVSYRRLDMLKRTMESLLPTLPTGSQMLIVDNNSPEPEVRAYLNNLARNPQVRVHYTDNKGWAHAVNTGLDRYSFMWKDFEYVLESNNDVEYKPNWWPRAKELMETYPQIGILGLWKSIHHGLRKQFPDGLMIKDNMPACAWLFRSKDLEGFLPFPEKGPTKQRGGNGEDCDVVGNVQATGKWVCGVHPDLATHLDGYDNPEGDNPAYV